MTDPASKSQVKRLAFQGVQATCWIGDRRCEGCGKDMATDGHRVWCVTPGCVYSAQPDQQEGR